MQKLKFKLLVLALPFVSLFAFAVPVAAQGPKLQDSLCQGVDTLQISSDNQTNDCQSEDANDDKVNELIKQVINIISAIVGVIAVVMIIIGGFRYITSGGQPDKVTSAKNTILYGLIGLVIVALAQVIVQFVLTKITGA